MKTASTMNVSIVNSTLTMSSEEAKSALERQLKEALSTRESTEAAMKSNQNELKKLFDKKGPTRPRETIAELDEQIAKLELERTIHSMSLADEREILKKIHKLNIRKREVEEFAAYDKQIKEKKSTVSELRERTKEQRTGITELKTELTTVQTAVNLGCEVKDLLGKKVECPAERLGNVIGKKGKNVQHLMSTTNVNVDIERKQGDIHLIGTIDSLSQATSNLEKTIQQTEEMVEVPDKIYKYLTSAKITTMQDLRERHPGIYFTTSQGDKDTGINSNIRVRGLPKDIEAFKNDLLSLKLVETELQLSSREAGLVVGKQGASINELVMRRQAAIDVQRPSQTDDQDITKVVVTGPSSNVAATVVEIEELVAANKDQEKSISMDPNVRSVLLLNNGAGIQTLHKKVNQATKKLPDLAISSYVAVNLSDGGVSIRGKAKVLESAIQIVKDEVTHIESMLVKIKVDPIVIPVMIGKSGAGIKKLREDTKTVNIELDSKIGEVSICGLERDEVEKVVAAVEAVKADNTVERVGLDCDEENQSKSFSAQFRNFLRSAAMKEVRELAFFVADDALKQIVLRGKPEKVAKAVTIVNDFLALNYFEELTVMNEDLTALLTGGKNSKIVELGRSTGVNLSTDRDRKTIIARGAKEKVINALKEVREFLYGGADVAVKKITLESSDLMGIVIGKGGKTKAALQEKYGSTSILVHRTEAAITLRGPKQEVEDCHVEITKLTLSATISQSVDLSEKELKDIKKSRFSRSVTEQLPVQAIVSTERSSITFRGSATDVQDAISMLKERTNGVYEGRMRPGSSLFRKVKDACRNPAHFDRIEKQSQAKVSLDEKKGEIVISGKRECVKHAKRALLTFFDFLFGPSMSRIEVNGPLLALIAKPSTIAEIAAQSGAQVILDRDLSSILLFSASPDKIQKATESLKPRLLEGENLVYVLQLEPSEDWIVSMIIGKKGVGIKKLRAETECNIEVTSKERKVTISSDKAELVIKAREILHGLVDKARKECAFIALPDKALSAFVGRSGVNIKEFSEKYGVEVQIMSKIMTSTIRLTGEEHAVAAALSGAKEWLAAREEAHKDATVEETKRLRADQIPALIGVKGSVIRGLQAEFRCKIDIDRNTSTVTVSGGSKEKRAALLDKIEKIVSEEKEEPATQHEADSETLDAVEEKTTKKANKPKNTKTEMKGHSQEQKPAATNPTMTETDFPALQTGKSKKAETRTSNEPADNKPWNKNLAHSTQPKEKTMSVEKPTFEDDSDEVAFVGDVIEACDEQSENYLEQTD